MAIIAEAVDVRRRSRVHSRTRLGQRVPHLKKAKAICDVPEIALFKSPSMAKSGGSCNALLAVARTEFCSALSSL